MAKAVFLDFEKDLGEIAAKIEELETKALETGVSAHDEIARLQREMDNRTSEIYRDLTPWQTALVARHPNRPYTLDYVDAIFEDFHELHGDRCFADDQSIVGGLARLAEIPVMVIGHQKGRDTRERTRRNFGMTKPEGYRKALRLMKLSEKFNLPVFTFVDTPGAYPGIDAEERNQSEAIGRNIFELAKLRVPVISTIIGEGGSGGALAIAVSDCLIMLQYATYSVISPEGCASILWKSAEKAADAAQALALTSDRLCDLGLVDRVVSEPLGGAHRNPKLMASGLKKVLVDRLKEFAGMPVEELLARRMKRLMQYGRFETQGATAAELICGADEKTEDTTAAASSRCAVQVKPAPKKARASKAAAAKVAAEKAAAQAVAEEPVKAEAKTAAKPASKTAAKPAARKTAAKKTVKATETPAEDVKEAAPAAKPKAAARRRTTAKKPAQTKSE